MGGKEMPKALQVAVLIVGVSLRRDARKQGSRQSPLSRAFGFIHPCSRNQHIEVGLERLLNRILQGEPVRCLLRKAGCARSQACQQNQDGSTDNAIHGFDS